MNVGELCVRNVITVREHDELSKPVIGRNGLLVGVLSLDDILGSLSAELLDVAGSVRNEVRVEKALRP